MLASNLEENLACWMNEIREIVSPPILSGKLTLQANQNTKFAPPRLLYRSVTDSDLCALYWSMSIYIHELINQVQTQLSILSSDISSSIPRDHRLSEVVAEAGKIA